MFVLEFVVLALMLGLSSVQNWVFITCEIGLTFSTGSSNRRSSRCERVAPAPDTPGCLTPRQIQSWACSRLPLWPRSGDVALHQALPS